MHRLVSERDREWESVNERKWWCIYGVVKCIRLGFKDMWKQERWFGRELFHGGGGPVEWREVSEMRSEIGGIIINFLLDYRAQGLVHICKTLLRRHLFPFHKCYGRNTTHTVMLLLNADVQQLDSAYSFTGWIHPLFHSFSLSWNTDTHTHTHTLLMRLFRVKWGGQTSNFQTVYIITKPKAKHSNNFKPIRIIFFSLHVCLCASRYHSLFRNSHPTAQKNSKNVLHIGGGYA